MQSFREFKLAFVLTPIFIVLIFFCQPLRAEPVKPTLYFDLGTETGWFPYRTGNKEGDRGILAELVDLLEIYSEIDFEPVYLPMKRAEQALIQGVVDFDFVCREWLPNENIGDQFTASNYLFEINEYVITLKGKSHLFPSLDAIYGKRIGTIGGYFYHDDDKFTRVDFLDEHQLIKGLKHGRFDAIILEGESAVHWAKKNEVDIEFAALHSKGHLLLRLNKRNEALLTDINTAINRIKKSGELTKILKKYNVKTRL